MRKRVVLSAVFLFFGYLTCRLVWLLWLVQPAQVITLDKVAKIQPGMTQAEVEAVLGPSGNRGNLKPVPRFPWVRFDKQQPRCRIITWYDDFAGVGVLFKEDGTVHSQFPLRIIRRPDSFEERLRTLLGKPSPQFSLAFMA